MTRPGIEPIAWDAIESPGRIESKRNPDMDRRPLVLLWALLVVVAFSSPLSADDCSSPDLQDPYACLELLVEYDPASFDLAAFNAYYGTIVEVDILLSADPA